MTSYLAGVSLDKVQANSEDFILTMQSQNGSFDGIFVMGSIVLFHQARVLKDGLCVLDAKPSNNILSEEEALQQWSGPFFQSNFKIHQLVRAYLFRKFDDLQSLDIVDVSDDIERNKRHLQPFLIFGIFFLRDWHLSCLHVKQQTIVNGQDGLKREKMC